MTLNAVSDLFSRCRNRETGYWRVGDESTRTVYIDSGDIVFASSNFQTDRLTTILVERNKLTQDQMNHALANLKPGMSVGKNLIEMGFITQRDLLDAARQQVERIVWAAMIATETPSFEPMDELEDNIVRLPIDTPSLLFAGVMGITDREGLQELLGPLNQVVFLQGKRAFELELPPDLEKMARLMDGTHTILELSSEAAVEPMRTGAFALFLREIGWGKLYELPPLDRQALDKALAVPDPTKPPDSIPSPRSMLFNAIEEAGKQTVRLDDLSSMLDNIESIEDDENHAESPSDKTEEASPESEAESEPALEIEIEPEPEPEPQPPAQSEAKSAGRIISLAEPAPSEPQDSDENSEDSEHSIIISGDDPASGPPLAPDEKGGDEKKPKKTKPPKPPKPLGKPKKPGRMKKIVKKLLRALTALAILTAIAAAVYFAWNSIWNLKTRQPDPPFTIDPDGAQPLDETETSGETEVKPVSGSTPEPNRPKEAVKPTPDKKTTDQPPQAAQPSKPSAEAASADASARFKAIADGDATKALSQWNVIKTSIPKTTWTIRLIVACQQETLQNCANALAASKPELFLAPIRLKDGRHCYQLFMGKYSNKAVAEAEAKKLPELFRQGQKPIIMQMREISGSQ